MNWKSILGTIGGAALSFIPGGSLIAQGLRAVGPSIANAAATAGGSQAVTDKLTQAGNQALDLQRQQTAVAQAQLERAGQIQQQLYQDSVNRLSPYTSLANGALGLLGQGLGVSVTPMQPNLSAGRTAFPNVAPSVPTLGQAGLSTVRPGNAQGIVTNPMGPTLTPNGLQYLNGVQGPSTGLVARSGEPVSSAVQRGSSYAGAAPGTVLMEAPDGSRMPVPSTQVQTWLQRGAKVVG